MTSSDVFQKQPSEVFCKKVVLKNFAKSQQDTYARVSFLLKIDSAQVFPCEFLRAFLGE